MRASPPAPSGWRRVTRQSPCPVCNKPDWCSLTRDGAVVVCMRIPSRRQLNSGGWLHRVTEPFSVPHPSTTVIGPAIELAPVEQRHRVYRAFARELGLLPGHEDHLLEVRGLPTLALEGFASTPARESSRRREIAANIIRQLRNDNILRGVPGFYVDQGGCWTCRSVPQGILVPVPDPTGQIQAFQVRIDRPDPSGQRYIWLSSRGRSGGSSPGAPVAFWQPEFTTNSTILITEGNIKGAVAAWHLSAWAIAVPGVAAWRGALNFLPRGIAVAIAYDADSVVNPHVARHERELARHLFWRGHPVSIARWVPECKGIDDALLAGKAIDLRDWPGGSRSSSLRERVKPAEAVFAEASE